MTTNWSHPMISFFPYGYDWLFMAKEIMADSPLPPITPMQCTYVLQDRASELYNLIPHTICSRKH